MMASSDIVPAHARFISLIYECSQHRNVITLLTEQEQHEVQLISNLSDQMKRIVGSLFFRKGIHSLYSI